MMDLSALIGQYAFPIVACCAMAYYVKYQNESNREDMKALRENYEEEIDKLTVAVNNNTGVLKELLTLLSRKE